MKKLVLGSILGLAANASFAVPTLQLDIAGGSYDPVTQTVIAPDDTFNLYALYNTQMGSTMPVGTYYLSAAITPQTPNASLTTFGSFTVNGTTYSAANMNFGNPPAAVSENNDDLQSHGIFDTHYAEIGFTFDLNNTATLYNTQDNPGGLNINPNGSLIYQAFAVDLSGLSTGYNVHFDLYKLGLDSEGNITVTDFAPFSHDAQGGHGVPDPASTALLLGGALAALEGFRRRFAKQV
jgi:hypothetical protein